MKVFSPEILSAVESAYLNMQIFSKDFLVLIQDFENRPIEQLRAAVNKIGIDGIKEMVDDAIVKLKPIVPEDIVKK